MTCSSFFKLEFFKLLEKYRFHLFSVSASDTFDDLAYKDCISSRAEVVNSFILCVLGDEPLLQLNGATQYLI